MKNLLAVPVFVLAAVMLAGCSGEQPVAQPDGSESESAPAEEELSENDWMSLLGKGKAVECSVPGGGMATKMYAEGKNYRTETEIDGKRHLSVSDGKTMWTWTEGEKQGMKMEFSCMDDIRSTTPEEGGPAPEYAASPEEALGEKPDISCSESGPIDISVPDDIVFADQCALMKTQLQAMEEMKKNLPSLPDMNRMPELPDDVKKMMGQ